MSDRRHPKGAARLVCIGADNTVRWTKGERLHHLFEQHCDALARAGEADHAAIVTDDETVSFRTLDERANQAARYLLAQGLTSGDRIGLMFDMQCRASHHKSCNAGPSLSRALARPS